MHKSLIIDEKKSEATEIFFNYVNDWLKYRNVCYDSNHKRNLKCNYCEKLKVSKNFKHLSETESKIAATTTEWKHKYIRSIILVGSYVTANDKVKMSGRIKEPICKQIRSMPELSFCKHTVYISLYSTLTKPVHKLVDIEAGMVYRVVA